MRQDIRIGIVGAGTNTKVKHIPGLKKIKGVKIASVCNRSGQSSEKAAKEFKIPRVYDDWKQLVTADDINAVVIGTWPYMHCPVTLAALEAGKHVMCEARMARNYTEAKQMYETARLRPNLVTQIVPSPMTLKFDVYIKKLIADGYLGDILAIDLHSESRFIDPDEKMHWRYDSHLSGLNTLSMGIWYEALLRWVGPAKRLAAMTKTFVNKRLDEPGNLHWLEIPDHVDVIAEMVCGAQARMRFTAAAGHSEGPAVYLFGSQGTLCLKKNSLLGAKRKDDRLKKMSIPKKYQSGWRVEEEFVNAIRGREEIKLTSFDDGLKYMEFTEAVHKSAKTGLAVSLPL